MSDILDRLREHPGFVDRYSIPFLRTIVKSYSSFTTDPDVDSIRKTENGAWEITFTSGAVHRVRGPVADAYLYEKEKRVKGWF